MTKVQVRPESVKNQGARRRGALAAAARKGRREGGRRAPSGRPAALEPEELLREMAREQQAILDRYLGLLDNAHRAPSKAPRDRGGR